MAGSNNGVVPSKLLLLSALHTVPRGDKVRFLGCVTGYSTKAAVLTLEHNHPPGNQIKAMVDIGLLVETLKSRETQIGEWINVIGYIVSPQMSPRHSVAVMKATAVSVQALVLWSSGPLKLHVYEQHLEKENLDTTIHKP